MESPREIERKVRQLDNDIQAIYDLLAAVEATQKRHENRLNEIVASQTDRREKLGLRRRWRNAREITVLYCSVVWSAARFYPEDVVSMVVPDPDVLSESSWFPYH